MENVTITLDGDVAKWARIQAAELDTSLSLLVAELLSEKMKEEAGYASAMKRYLSSSPKPLKNPAPLIPGATRYMNARIFVDTNILVYTQDSSEPEKQPTGQR